jgi:hypothetical protein
VTVQGKAWRKQVRSQGHILAVRFQGSGLARTCPSHATGTYGVHTYVPLVPVWRQLPGPRTGFSFYFKQKPTPRGYQV